MNLTKRFVFVITCFCIFILQGCYKECKTDNDNYSANQINSAKISSETAVMIAKGLLCFDYDLENYDVSVEETSESWEIKFSRKDIKTSKFGPMAFVSKTNGEVTRLINAK